MDDPHLLVDLIKAVDGPDHNVEAVGGLTLFVLL